MYSTGSGMYTLSNKIIYVVSEHNEYLYFVNVCFIIKSSSSTHVDADIHSIDEGELTFLPVNNLSWLSENSNDLMLTQR